MGMDIWSCMALVVLFALGMHCLGIKADQEQTLMSCPQNCDCDSDHLIVSCSHISGVSWIPFLSTVPEETKTLVIKDSSFNNDESNVLSNYNFPFLSKLEMLRSNITDLDMIALFNELRQLMLDQNRIGDLSSSIFRKLPFLESLSLKGNNISFLENDTFQYAKHLRQLNLSENNLQHLPPHIFQPMTMLEVLDLSSNQLQFVHPETFRKNTNIKSVHLQSNDLSVIYEATFANLTSISEIDIHDNPLDCSCGLQWLSNLLADDDRNELFKHRESIVCNSPTYLKSVEIKNITDKLLDCKKPRVDFHPSDIKILRSDSRVLFCNASGYPKPSIYWITPAGILVDPHHRKYITSDILHFPKRRSFVSRPTYSKALLEAHEDGTLTFHNFHNYLAGEYACVAENPGGISVAPFNVTIRVPIQEYVHFSMLMGGATALGFFLILGIISSMKMCFIVTSRIMRETVHGIMKGSDCGEKNSDIEQGFESDYINYDDDDDDERESPNIYKRYSPAYGFGSYIYGTSPWESPKKCATPAEALDAEVKFDEQSADISERLNDVRDRLRHGVERQVGRIRTRAQNVKDSGSKYMQHIRDNSQKRMQTLRASSSHYIHNIRSSGSQYANRMRAGVVLGVEQVKYHVQSMKEFCGNSDIMHTISVVSVSTNVDSQEMTAVVKTVKQTYV